MKTGKFISRNLFKILVPTAIVVGLAAVAGIVLWNVNSKKVPEVQQNIYFLKHTYTFYHGRMQNKDTVILKYDPVSDEVVEIGIVSGYFYNCIMDAEETCITGILRDNATRDRYIVEFNLKDSTTQYKNIQEEIDDLVSNAVREAMLYDDGNKLLVSYIDNAECKWILSYDLTTEKYEEVSLGKDKTSAIMTFDGHMLWYISGDTIYRYDWETQEKTKVLDSASVNSASIALDTGLIAYENVDMDEIYLYDTNQGKSSCIVPYKQSTLYGNLSSNGKNAMWSRDSRQFLYIQYNFLYALNWRGRSVDVSMMLYDVESGRRRCIYEDKDTLCDYEYVDQVSSKHVTVGQDSDSVQTEADPVYSTMEELSH